MSGVDFVFNISVGRVAEKIQDAAANVGVIVLRTTALESDGTLGGAAGLRDRVSLADILSVSSEPTNTNYARKTGITGTPTISNANDRVDVSIPNQTWTGVLAGDVWAKLIVYYEESASDANRIPLTAHTFDVTPNGADITAQFAAAGFFRAASTT